MSHPNLDNTVQATDKRETAQHEIEEPVNAHDTLDWETPRLEDVSEQVMAQPYIRFT